MTACFFCGQESKEKIKISKNNKTTRHRLIKIQKKREKKKKKRAKQPPFFKLIPFDLRRKKKTVQFS